MHFSLYNEVVIFDNLFKLSYMVCWTNVNDFESVEEAYLDGLKRMKRLCRTVNKINAPSLINGFIDLQLSGHPTQRAISNMTKEKFLKASFKNVDKTEPIVVRGKNQGTHSGW